MCDTLKFDPEGYCKANDDPRWNQSFYFSFYDPVSRIGSFIRVGILENLRESNNWFVFFRDGKPLFSRLNMNLPYTGQRLAAGIELSGIRMKAVRPLEEAHITFEGRDFAVNLRWVALHEMSDSIAMSAKEGGTFTSNVAQVHLEGPCRITGTVGLRNGETIAINGAGFRDVSVGPRNWDALLHYTLAWPIFQNGVTFAGIRGISTGGQNSYMKHFHDGSRWLHVVAIEDRNVYEADDLTLRSMHWKFRDELNRQWEFTAKPLFRWFFPFDTFVVAEHMMEYRLSDGTIGYGMGECGFRFPWEGIGNR